MANTTPTIYMNLPNPVPGEDPGPDYADNLYSSLVILDQHDHTPGSGQQIAPDGLNINNNLPFNGNNAIDLRSVRFRPQSTPIPGSTPDLGCLYESGVDLYYNDGSGNQIRITQSGTVAGASGTITGLPSGTASAAFVAPSGTFVFQQATNTGANMDIATLILRYPGSYPTPAGNFIAIQAPSSLATGFAFTLPANTPASNGSFLTSDTAGTLSYTNVDNSTLEITASVIQVKDQGITQSKLAPRVSAGTTAALGEIASAPTGTVTVSTPVGVYNQVASITITTGGSLVRLAVVSTTGQYSLSTSTNILFQCQWVNTTTASIVGGSFAWQNTGGGLVVAPSFEVYDAPAAGTYTYGFQISGTALTIQNAVIVVYELN